MRGQPVTNHQLEALIAASGQSHAALARQVKALAKERHGLKLSYDQTSVYYWLRGRVPDEPAPQLIAEVLTHKLGQTVHVDELGFAPYGDAVLGLAVSASPTDTVSEVRDLWRFAIQRRSFLTSSFSITAAVGAGFEWSFAPATADLAHHDGVHTIGSADVDRLRTARDEFITLDRLHGGGHAFFWLVDYLDREVGPLLAGRYTDAVGRDLFAAAAALTEQAGYMAFDAFDHGMQGVAQKFFTQALALAKEAGDRAYGGYILTNLATQALFLGHGTEATRLARAARVGAGKTATATMQTRLAVVEARGWGLVGDQHEGRRAIQRATKAFDRANPNADPDWLATFTPAHYAGSIMHALKDLGQLKEAECHAPDALALPETNVRTRALHQVLHAAVLAASGDLDAACHCARTARTASTGLRSSRLAGRLREFEQQLAPHATVPAVADYLEECRELRPRG